MEETLSPVEKKALVFTHALLDMYKDEDNRRTSDMEKLELGQDFAQDLTAMLIALSTVYDMAKAGVSDKELNEFSDLIRFTHLLNSLAVQYILDCREAEE